MDAAGLRVGGSATGRVKGVDEMNPELGDPSSTALLERAAGALLISACGDALGAGYEFDPPERIPAEVGMVGGGLFGWEPGEWTDDTSMAFVIAEVAASGVDLRDEQAQDRIAAGWYAWMRQAKDVGAQTRTVLTRAASGSGCRPPRRCAAKPLNITSGLGCRAATEA